MLFQLMKILTTPFLLLVFINCTDKKTAHVKKEGKNNQKSLIRSEISAIDAKFPLYLDRIDLQDKKNCQHLNDGINSKIEQTIKDYYFNECLVDSTGKNHPKDTYINTIRLYDSLQTIFLVLLKHYPSGELNCKALFYDNATKDFADKALDFKIYALYHFENGKLEPTNLKTAFKITTPEIELVDFNHDGINDYKLTRLFHNGTFNAIQTTIISVKNAQWETLNFSEKGL